MSRAAVNALLEHPKRHPVTTQEFLRMGEAGVFAPDSRLELIGGEIVEMAPIGSAHAGTVAILTRLFSRAAGERALVWAQNPIIVSDRSVPQPDVALLRPRSDSYTRSHPTAADVLLVVEVSDTTLAFDLNTKAPLYGRCGVPQLWVVDLAARIVRVQQDPGDAGYATVFTASAATGLEPVLMPGARIALGELFP